MSKLGYKLAEYEITAPDFDGEGNLGNIWLNVVFYRGAIKLRQYDGKKSRHIVLSAKELTKLYKLCLMEALDWIEHE